MFFINQLICDFIIAWIFYIVFFSVSPMNSFIFNQTLLYLVAQISMSTPHKKIRSHAFFHLIRFENFPQTCIFTYKKQRKYPTPLFIQDHNIISGICCLLRKPNFTKILRKSFHIQNFFLSVLDYFHSVKHYMDITHTRLK